MDLQKRTRLYTSLCTISVNHHFIAAAVAAGPEKQLHCFLLFVLFCISRVSLGRFCCTTHLTCLTVKTHYCLWNNPTTTHMNFLPDYFKLKPNANTSQLQVSWISLIIKHTMQFFAAFERRISHWYVSFLCFFCMIGEVKKAMEDLQLTTVSAHLPGKWESLLYFVMLLRWDNTPHLQHLSLYDRMYR